MHPDKRKIADEMIVVFQKSLGDIVGLPVILTYRVAPHEEKILKLQQIIADAFGMSWEVIKSNGRYMNVVIARQLFCWFAFYECGIHKSRIGEIIGKDHTSVIHSIQKIKNMIDTKDDYIMPFFKKVEEILNQYEAKVI